MWSIGTWSILILFALLQAAQYSGGEITEQLIKKFNNQKYCHTQDAPLDLYSCNEDKQQDTIDTGKSCLGKSKFDNKTYVASCVEGRWLVTSHEVSNPRQKRYLGVVLGVISVATAIAGTVCSFLCDQGGEEYAPPPSNTPPIVTCPDIGDVTASSGTSAIVSWDTPIASDQEDGELEVNIESGKNPGSLFQRGSHSITYSATDSEGLKGFCTITFQVFVITCSQPEIIANGYVQCNGEIVSGSKCQYNCFDGYELTENYNTITCTQDKVFDRQPPSCRRIQCGNDTNLYPQHGSFHCSQQFQYQSTCTTSCNEGFALSMPSLITCQENKQWSGTLSSCIDNQPPEFENCPESITVYTEPGKTTAIANWTIPTAMDNNGKSVTVLQTQGVKLGSDVGKGFHEIRYKATDSNGNTSPECIFFLYVEQVTCGSPWPVFNDEYLSIQCSGGSGYGSRCQLSCKGSYPLIGNNSIVCEMNNTGVSAEGVWYWGEGNKPYCKQNPCPTLTPPKNGALSCDRWMFGKQCMMQCNDQFDLPLVGAHGLIGSFSGLFTCSTSSGKWSPTSDVPGCTSKRNPSSSKLPAEIFYYSGSCNDLATQDQIKQNFIDKMNELQKLPGWQGVCPNTDQCNVENVEVTCGSTSRRRRREFRFRRTTNLKKIKLSFSLTSDWHSNGKSAVEMYVETDSKLKQLGSMIQTETKNGAFDVTGANIDRNSMVFYDSDIKCDKGQFPLYATLTCGSCPPGTYLNTASRECIECKKGSFKSDIYEETCTQCPSGTSTIESGSKNMSDCIKFCQPGYFSFNGLEPCTPCTVSEYQPSWMSTKCIKCPSLSTTSLKASVSLDNCTEFDVGIGPSVQEILPSTFETTLNSFSFSAWIKFAKKDFSFSLTISTDKHDVSILIGEYLEIRINGLIYGPGISLNTSMWQHVAFTIDKSNNELTAYKNGIVLHSRSIHLNGSLAEKGSEFRINMTSFQSVLRLSNVMLVPVVLSNLDIKTISKSCKIKRTDSVLTMDHFKFVDAATVELTAPSTCKVVNDYCNPNPCNGNKCTNTIDSYECMCSGGYSGTNCENPPDYCRYITCKNGGTCISGISDFTCECKSGFKGNLCEVQIVNGNWNTWEEWSACSASCGGGTRNRIRQCNNPPPDEDGKPCLGVTRQTLECGITVCPSCQPLQNSSGVIKSCNTTGESVRCSVKCEDGMVFIPGFTPLDVYRCGPDTYYEWNGQPPPCSRVYSPSSLEGIASITYVDFPCGSTNEAKRQILENAKSLPCVENKTCKIVIRIPDCSTSGKRKKRTLSSGKIFFDISSPLHEGDNLDVKSYLGGKTVTSSMLQLLEALSDLEKSLQQLNKSSDIFKLNLGAAMNPFMTVISADTICPSGQIRKEAFCVECPPGTRNSHSGTCIPCTFGTYQDKPGQTFCKSCPSGYTTIFQQSTSELMCTKSLDLQKPYNTNKISVRLIIFIVVSCIAVLAVACVVVITFFRQKNEQTKSTKGTQDGDSIAARKPFKSLEKSSRA